MEALGKQAAFERLLHDGLRRDALLADSAYQLLVQLFSALSRAKCARRGLEAQLAQAQLQALKMQLHPHFLFNTLHSISALVHKNADAADKMIARLGDFLRLTLENSGAQEVSLGQELEFLKCYLGN